MGLVDAFGDDKHELAFIGYSFLQLATLIRALREKLCDSGDSLVKGIEVFVRNESCLNKCDAKLHCCTFEHILDSFIKVKLIEENDKTSLLKMYAPVLILILLHNS